jgi:hypothetical protein
VTIFRYPGKKSRRSTRLPLIGQGLGGTATGGEAGWRFTFYLYFRASQG